MNRSEVSMGVVFIGVVVVISPIRWIANITDIHRYTLHA